MSMKNSNDTIGNRTLDLPTCSAVSQPTALPRAPIYICIFLILMDPCIVDYSVEVPTRSSVVIEFIIPEFFKGSTCLERHTAHYQEHWVPTQPWQRPVTIWAYKPEAANTVYSSWWWAVCSSKHVEPLKNFGIINSITKLHLVGTSTEYICILVYKYIYFNSYHLE